MKNFNNKITLNLDSDAEVNVKGIIAPIEYTEHNFHIDWDELANLQVAEPEKQHPTSVFQSFLPPTSVSVGECWEIKEAGALELLRQLQPNPDLDVGVSRGRWACLRAYNNQIAVVVFRIHARFDLAEGWLTPSQFAGTLIIDQIEKQVVFFQMHVPDGTLNFDAIRWTGETYKGRRRYSTDLGFCPQMELCAGTQDMLYDTEFTEAITQTEAVQALALNFYKSEQINWVPLEDALGITQAQGKPIHAISISGPLADESC